MGGVFLMCSPLFVEGQAVVVEPIFVLGLCPAGKFVSASWEGILGQEPARQEAGEVTTDGGPLQHCRVGIL